MSLEDRANEALHTVLTYLFVIFTIFSILALAITGAVGIYLTVFAVWFARGDLIKSVPFILEGIELLLLSPVPFAVIECVGAYLITLRFDRDNHTKSADRLNQVKGLVATLIVTVVAVELLRRFISTTPSGMADLYYGGGLVIILLAYRIVVFGLPSKR